jgi:hypothetical protein
MCWVWPEHDCSDNSLEVSYSVTSNTSLPHDQHHTQQSPPEPDPTAISECIYHSPNAYASLRTLILFSEKAYTQRPIPRSPILLISSIFTLSLLSIFRSSVPPYFGSAFCYLGPYSYYLLLFIYLPRLLFASRHLSYWFLMSVPFVSDRSLCS